MRVCNECGSSTNEFEHNRRVCKECRNAYKRKYSKENKRDRTEERQQFYRTKDGRIKFMFHNQTMASKKRGHDFPEYSKEELIEWCMNQEKYHQLYEQWVLSGYEKRKTPSIDRMNNKKGYSFDNIQLMTWEENDNLAHEHCKNGLLSTGIKNMEVEQYSLDGKYIQTFPTINSACRYLGKKCYKEIKKCCDGKFKQTQGYKWKFANKEGNKCQK